MVNEIPHDDESEKALIGIVLHSGSEAFEEIQLSCTPAGLFYDERNRELWNRAERIHRSHKPISFQTITKERVEFDIQPDYLTDLETNALTLSFLHSYLPDAIQAQKRRAALNTGLSLMAQAQILSNPIDQTIDEAEQDLFSARFRDDEQPSLKQSINDAITDWEAAAAAPNVKTGVLSGFSDLDYLTWGFQPKNLIIIGARPSQGKTALLCNIAEHAAVQNNVPTLFFSLEMTAKELAKRLICSIAKASSSDLRSGNLPGRQFPAVTIASGRLSKSPLTIIDRGNITIGQLRSIARRQTRKHGIKLILVDYLQKIKSSGKHEKRTYEVGEVSTGLKELAKEIGVPVVTACQLNRESEKDKGRPPRPSDLGDSGMIERDADLVACLYRDPNHDPDKPTIPYKLFLQKHRDGACGTVNLSFFKHLTRFESAAHTSQDDDGIDPSDVPRNPHSD